MSCEISRSSCVSRSSTDVFAFSALEGLSSSILTSSPSTAIPATEPLRRSCRSCAVLGSQDRSLDFDGNGSRSDDRECDIDMACFARDMFTTRIEHPYYLIEMFINGRSGNY